MRRLSQIEERRTQRHGSWIWQFSYDGTIDDIAATLSARGLAAIVKTHDGVEWMAAYDHVPGAIAGPAEAATAAAMFENAGVPFHAWCVVRGVDPVREAAMAAQVLDAGARSLTIDLEEGDGFWEGTREGAQLFGRELRNAHPNARIDISIDPRPWKWFEIPLLEFVDFTDGIRPQLYWDMFDSPEHARAFAYMGYPPPDEGITPEFMAETAHALLSVYDRWILPIGPASVDSADQWWRFVNRCAELQMHAVSAWRHGLMSNAALDALAGSPPPRF